MFRCGECGARVKKAKTGNKYEAQRGHSNQGKSRCAVSGRFERKIKKLGSVPRPTKKKRVGQRTPHSLHFLNRGYTVGETQPSRAENKILCGGKGGGKRGKLA